ncbi:MAG: DNA replication/repair protein RecF [Candidatus Margulisiibacteriota bacterium]|nr:MAG: DNA replication/repair protein RecF [Candidatus Margulisiibacteriota bacterium]HAR63468.1 DNA replication/repair protein RecF [Candidatus Margulisiibacteriota bacterium]HCT85626.1 DNA replication/repair protein RecF [Candidatus Margulisiibacteriota bacterium]HCY37332.1 DNA replication/repair protein RecF [Candidatus Margulisiibacteriota bacterium]
MPIMIIKSLELENFRNYSKAKIDIDPYINILVGLNAQGKTNILEAIFLIATSKSHRIQKNNELIKFQEDHALVSLRAESLRGNNFFNIQVMNDNNKQIHVNGKRIKRATELLGYFNVVLFSPEDIDIVCGSPIDRRKFIDIFVSQVKPSYAVLLSDYYKVLKQRNKTLKDISKQKCKEDMLNMWDEQLVNLSYTIVNERLQAIKSIEEKANKFYSYISDYQEQLTIEYYSGIGGKDKYTAQEYKHIFQQKIKSSLKMDIILGTTSCGPHRDDMLLKLNDKEAKLYASQGQKRLVSLSLKYAEVEYIRENTGEYPVLLFDDVLLELDLKRKHKLFEELIKKAQIIITTTDLKRYQEVVVKAATIFSINQGEVIKGT